MKWLVNWFSNMNEMSRPLVHEAHFDPITYTTVEHFYQAMKFKDEDRRKSIAAIPSPYGAKKRAQFWKEHVDPKWRERSESVMWAGLCWKFRGGSPEALVLASTYDVELVEWNNWHDNFWGWCICDRCSSSDIRPLNKLGKQLMDIREGLCND